MAITFQPLLETTTATIPAGGSVSPAVDLHGGKIVAIQLGGTAWDAAGITFQASADNVTYNDVYDESGNEVALTVDASRYIVFDSVENLRGVRYLKVRSGTTGTPVNQTAATAVTLVVEP